MIVCGIVLFTATVCWTWVAAWYWALPAWLASMTHEPGWLKVTVEPTAEHTEVLAGSMLNFTWLPEPPPVAAT